MANKKIFSKAPYNFVPLNKVVLTSEVYNPKNGFSSQVKRNCYRNEMFTGSISLKIVTESPLFIGSIKVNAKNKRGFKEIKPYLINGDPAIPGSSLRGMFYNLYEIASFSPMVNLEDSPVYFRSTQSSFNGNLKLRFGILSPNGEKYEIFDLASEKEVMKISWNNVFDIINNSNYIGISSGFFKGIHAFGVKKLKVNFKNVRRFRDGFVQKVVRDYQNDKNRNVKLDIISKCRTNTIEDGQGNSIHGCPVWFSIENNEVKSIGISKYHRIPSTCRTIDMLPKNHREAFEKRSNYEKSYEQNPFPLSKTEILFGTSETHRSKLRFTDAVFRKGPGIDLCEYLLRPLLSPKIKSAKLYLKSQDNDPTWNKRKKGQVLRGFKAYFNKSSDYKNWFEEIERNRDSSKYRQQQNLQAIIRPVQKDSVFESTIYFENITKEELGCLLFIIKLKEDLRHSLGMGKPYGLGRVQIKIDSLNLFEIRERYSNLNSQSIEMTDEDISTYIREFEQYILKEVGHDDLKSLWELERFQNLQGLTIKRKRDDDLKSEYMTNYKPFMKKLPIIDDPQNLSSYRINGRDFLEK